MALVELRIENVRCIESATLHLSNDLNLVFGPNGAGKTSILESVFLLGRGRSFRTRSSEKLIRHGQANLVVFGRIEGERAGAAGVEVTRAGTRGRINGSDADSLLELSSILPVQAIDPEIHKLIDQGPERRRRWLDWLVFHVEPTFGSHWGRFQRALKQRNAALKAPGADFRVWDEAFVEHGRALTHARLAVLERLKPYLETLLGRFAGLEISMAFHAGWGQEHDLREALHLSANRDQERGSSTTGPHRADVILRYKSRSARETLSRGQQKLTAVAMIVAQLKFLQREQGTQATLLLDDPAAELDARNLALLFEELASLKCQMVATSLGSESMLFQAPKAVFHVEQGRVLRV